MSYQDMARSHVKELVRETFDLSEVVDEDDLSFPCGSAMLCESVVRDGCVLRLWSRGVIGLRVNMPVQREMDEVNVGLRFSRVSSRHDGVWVEGCLPIEMLRVPELQAPFHEVGTTADRLGSTRSRARRSRGVAAREGPRKRARGLTNDDG